MTWRQVFDPPQEAPRAFVPGSFFLGRKVLLGNGFELAPLDTELGMTVLLGMGSVASYANRNPLIGDLFDEADGTPDDNVERASKMSSFPAPVVVPLPRMAGSSRDYQTPEHEEALKAVWRKLDCGLERLFGWKPSKVREQSKEAMAGFEAQMESVAATILTMAERSGEPDLDQWLRATRERVLSSTVCGSVGQVSRNIAAVELTKRELAKELVEERNARTARAREEVVGYIDIAVDIRVPTRLRLRGNLPVWLIRDREEVWRDPLKWMRQDATKHDELKNLVLSVPEWFCERRDRQIWVDVRATCPPVGQMLREVKVLRALSDKKATIVMALPKNDPDLEAMFRNENVVVTTHQWWREL
ncbi:hypothetical protein [Ottowia sp.]|uniref:hypothetical protein n=1 Tax=Ottowia sp. TaxID=1898956 RepID=UPI0025FB3272|nr:hypothetical protein [Ottowia sp.]MBK6616556.1 hypothetical protein [Ottowia sp.]